MPVVTVMRPYTKLYHDYSDEVAYYLSASAWKCLTFLMRHITGFKGRESVRLTIPQLCNGVLLPDGRPMLGTGLSRNTVMTALDELAGYKLVASDASQRGRTEVRSYWLLDPEDWDMQALRQTRPSPFSPSIGLASATIELGGLASPDIALDTPSSSPHIALDARPTSPKSAPLRNKGIRIDRSKERPATQAAVPAASSEAPKAETVGKSPKDWPDQQPGEDLQALYRRALVICTNKPAAIAWMAHLSLGTDPGHETIRRLTGAYNQLTQVEHKPRRWGLIAKAILQAAATEIDSDPLDWVHKAAIALAQREKTSGAASGATRAVPYRRQVSRQRLPDQPGYWDEE